MKTDLQHSQVISILKLGQILMISNTISMEMRMYFKLTITFNIPTSTSVHTWIIGCTQHELEFYIKNAQSDLRGQNIKVESIF